MTSNVGTERSLRSASDAIGTALHAAFVLTLLAVDTKARRSRFDISPRPARVKIDGKTGAYQVLEP